MLLVHNSARFSRVQVCLCSAFLEPNTRSDLLCAQSQARSFPRICVDHDHHPLGSGSQGQSTPNMLSNSITGMFSSPSSVACVVHQNFSHSRRFRNTLCTDSVSPSCSVRSCCGLLQVVSRLSCRAGHGPSTLPRSPRSVFPRVPLPRGSSLVPAFCC